MPWKPAPEHRAASDFVLNPWLACCRQSADRLAVDEYAVYSSGCEGEDCRDHDGTAGLELVVTRPGDTIAYATPAGGEMER